MADASVSKTDTARCVGSSPTPGTIQSFYKEILFIINKPSNWKDLNLRGDLPLSKTEGFALKD